MALPGSRSAASSQACPATSAKAFTGSATFACAPLATKSVSNRRIVPHDGTLQKLTILTLDDTDTVIRHWRLFQDGWTFG